MPNLQITSGNPVQAFCFGPFEVEIAVWIVSIKGMTEADPYMYSKVLGTYSMHLQGSAGIQNSVLSLESSNLLAMRVMRVCSIKGCVITVCR